MALSPPGKILLVGRPLALSQEEKLLLELVHRNEVEIINDLLGQSDSTAWLILKR